jgi:hypothetical protein
VIPLDRAERRGYHGLRVDASERATADKTADKTKEARA